MSGPSWAAPPLPLELLPDTAVVGSDGRLSVGGVDLLGLTRELGTAVFVYDEQHLRNRCREAVAAFGDGVAYASKAFFCLAMARLAHDEGMCIDVSTGGELHVALRAGVPASRLVLHGNNKSERELTQALAAGVGRIMVDSCDEIDRLDRLVPTGAGPRPKVLLRVTPGVEAHTHIYVQTGQDDSKFGFGIASGAAAAAVARLRRPGSPVELVGIHAHIGSQIFELSSFERATGVLAGFFNPLGLEELCVGGGLGVAYVTGEKAPSITEWAAAVHDAVAAAGIAPAVRVTAEPGRAIVAAAGITCYTVGTIKEIPGIRTYVSVDGGMSDNPRPVLYGSGYEAFLPRATAAPRPFRARIVGRHCESGDLIVPEAYLPADVAVGDILATPVTGAYGHSMASNYNKVGRPPVVFVRDGVARTVVRRETYDDLLALDADDGGGPDTSGDTAPDTGVDSGL
ncbi:MAG: diaminopimelate decarboxylase [Acidimicrobiaceae bacterium]|nr:diaminopimelate decarboxylase [Acidimicrobiaceae bacterium]